MNVTIRYWVLTMLLAAAGGFLVVETQAFTASTAVPIAFAVAIGVTILALAATLEGWRRHGHNFVWPPALTVLLGAWTIIAMNVFPVLTESWLAFASGLAILALAVVALTMHELRTERVVHSIEIRDQAASGTSDSHAPEGTPVGAA